MQIRQLETEIGAKVFVRAPRHVILTEPANSFTTRATHPPRTRCGAR
jgi:DNA-binding transcriptional LysR family regulator